MHSYLTEQAPERIIKQKASFMNTFRMLNKLGSCAWMLQGGSHPLHQGTASPEFPGEGGHRWLAVLLGIVLSLPAVGMLAGGFALRRPWLAWAGVGIFLGMAIFYVVVAWQVVSGVS
jgi:hypothetical protein